jgi:hypothetical protein
VESGAGAAEGEQVSLDRRGFVGALLALAAIPAIVPGKRVRLLWSTWSEMCDHADVGTRTLGCYVNRNGGPSYLPDGSDEMGLWFNDGRLAREGDWIVRRRDGTLEIAA